MYFFLIGRYRESDLVKLDIQINGEPVEALSTIVHREKVLYLVKKLAY
jgi:GTP-binding protein LepA